MRWRAAGGTVIFAVRPPRGTSMAPRQAGSRSPRHCAALERIHELFPRYIAPPPGHALELTFDRYYA